MILHGRILGAAVLMAFATVARPSLGQAEICQASARIQLRPSHGLTCADGLTLGDLVDFAIVLTNDSAVVVGPGIPSRKIPAKLVNTCLGGTNQGEACSFAADCNSLVCGAAIVQHLSCSSESCAVALPGTFTFVPTGVNGCVESDPNVAGCQLNPGEVTGNQVDVTVNATGVSLPAGTSLTIATIRAQLTTEVPRATACGQFASRVDTGVILTTDPACDFTSVGLTGGDGVTFFISQPTTTPTPTPIPTPTSLTPTPTGTSTPTVTATVSPTPTSTVTRTATPPPATPTTTPSPTKDALRCRQAIAKSSARFLRAYVQTLAACRSERLKKGSSEACPDAGGTRTIAKAESALAKNIAKACEGVPLEATGFPAACPGFEGECTASVSSYDAAVGCLSCVDRAIGERATTDFYDDLGIGDPTVRSCQRAIGKIATDGFLGRLKLLGACEDLRLRGKKTGPCPDEDATVKLADIITAKARILCRACGGTDKKCDGTDDVLPPETGVVTCPAVATPTGRLCGASLIAVAEIGACSDCLAERLSTCAVAVATAPVAVPAACTDPIP